MIMPGLKKQAAVVLNHLGPDLIIEIAKKMQDPYKGPCIF
jgi:hypothetical protein